YYMVVNGLSATRPGLALARVIVLTTPGWVMSGRPMMHIRRYKISSYVGMVMVTLGVAALVWWPAMPLAWSMVASGLVGFGVGSVFPVATVSIQNAVERRDVGTATGAMNFFRALASALVVAIMGAILLAGLGVTPERGGVGVDLTVAQAGASGVAVTEVFRYVFVGGLAVAVLGLTGVVLLEERPLHGPP